MALENDDKVVITEGEHAGRTGYVWETFADGKIEIDFTEGGTVLVDENQVKKA